MLNRPFFRSRRYLIFGLILLILLISGFVAYQISDDESTSDGENQSGAGEPQAQEPEPYWLREPVPYPDVIYQPDFAPEAIDLNDEHTFSSLTYGIHTSFWWESDYRNLGLDHVNIMQFTHIRQKFAWRDIEPEKHDLPVDHPGRYVWEHADAMMADIQAKDVEVVIRLGTPPDWAVLSDETYTYGQIPFDMKRLTDYCYAIANRYQGQVAAYQVWNEPNLDREWGYHSPDPAAYVDLLAGCSEAIHRADPGVTIISAGLSPTDTRTPNVMPHIEFLLNMYEAGASRYFDVLGVHAPGYFSHPATDPASLDRRWWTFRHVEDIRAIMVELGDAHKQIAITEMGWTTDQRPAEESIYSWFGITPEQQGKYLADAYRYAAEHWRPWVGLMVTIYYPNPAWTEEDEEYWWAIGTTLPLPWGFEGRPAWPRLVQMEKISTNPDYAHPPRSPYFKPIVKASYPIP
jgi:hypothetical protein